MSSTISAGLVNVTNLTVNSTSSGAVTATNVTTTNLTANSVLATNFNTPDITVTGSLTAPNLLSNVKISQDRWHFPDPTGPFAVDIVQTGAINVDYTFDLFGRFSNKYHSTMDIQNGINVIVYAPSNRTGVEKDISASIVKPPIDSKNVSSWGNGIMTIEETVLAFPNVWSDNDPEFQEASNDWINRIYGYNPSTTAEIISSYETMTATTGYQNIINHNSGSIYTAKIFTATTEPFPGHTGYNTASQSEFSVEEQYFLGNDARYFPNVYTASNMPTPEQLIAELKNDSGKSPVILVIGGDDSIAVIEYPSLCAELASHGYVVVYYCQPFREPTTRTHTYLQPIMDVVQNGLFGDTSGVNPYEIEGFFSYNGMTAYGYFGPNMNNPSTFFNDTSGVNKFPLYYTDCYGRQNPNGFSDRVSVTEAAQLGTTITFDVSGNILKNSPISCEKNLYVIKTLLAKLGLDDSVLDFDNVASLHKSSGGTSSINLNNLVKSGGLTNYLMDASDNPINLFNIKTMTNLAGFYRGTSSSENIGIVFKNNDSGQANSIPDNASDILYGTDAGVGMPDGYYVPTFHYLQSSPNTFYADQIRGDFTEPLQYILAKTRVQLDNPQYPSGVPILEHTLIMHGPATSHVGLLDSYIGYNEQNQNSAAYDFVLFSYLSLGYTWPEKYAISEYLYTGPDSIPTEEQSRLKDYLYQSQILFLWFSQYLTPNKGITTETIMEYANKGEYSCVLGKMQLDSCEWSDPKMRFIGPHKLETITDASGIDHLQIFTGMNKIYESSESIHVSSNGNIVAPVNLSIDGSGSSISIDGVTINAAQLSALLALL